MLGSWDMALQKRSWKTNFQSMDRYTVCGLLGSLQVLPLWSLKTLAMHRMLSGPWTERELMEGVFVWRCPMGDGAQTEEVLREDLAGAMGVVNVAGAAQCTMTTECPADQGLSLLVASAGEVILGPQCDGAVAEAGAKGPEVDIQTNQRAHHHLFLLHSVHGR